MDKDLVSLIVYCCTKTTTTTKPLTCKLVVNKIVNATNYSIYNIKKSLMSERGYKHDKVLNIKVVNV